MACPLILPLSDCTDAALVGGKAAGLARLLAGGFPVPAGVCVTASAYEQTLQTINFSTAQEWRRACGLAGVERKAFLSHCQARIRQLRLADLSQQWTTQLGALNLPSTTEWAVRSSATNEDAAHASFAGLYRTHLAVPLNEIESAVKDLWAALWQETIVQYMAERGADRAAPAMAVVIQPTLDAERSGVAHSIHPVTGRFSHVAIDAIRGLAVPVVDGRVTPDQFIVHMNEAGEPLRIRKRLIADKDEQLVVAEMGLRSHPILGPARTEPSLSDEQLFALARVAKQVEGTFGHPVDLEWLFDRRQLWLVQARPITIVRPSSELTDDDCEWTRANFKETMPEVPSPMGLSFLRYFMDAYIVSQYRRLGCRIPDGLSSVRVLCGRPYLNVTLFYSLVGQLGGEPALNAEHMGGVELLSPPKVAAIGWPNSVRAGWLILREMRRCETQGPVWFARMKQQAERYQPDRIQHLSLQELAAGLDELGRWLDRHEVTFGIAAGVGQCLQALGKLLPGWLGPDWRRLFNAAMQGRSSVISAQQVVRLAELVQAARREPAAQQWLLKDSFDPSGFRAGLAGTEFLTAFECFLADYGHRAVGESDVMSPRMAEQPESILAVLRLHLRSPASADGATLLARQAQCRQIALAEIRRRLGWRWDRRAIFQWWYRRLARFCALREANRHHLMYYSTAVRHLLLRVGELLVAEGRMSRPDDIFFVTLEERTSLFTREPRDWKALIAIRRAERARHAAIHVPDTIRDWEEAVAGESESTESTGDDLLRGLPISVGVVTGPARLVRSPSDWGRLNAGDILVAPVIDPGMAPLFGIAGGLISEMGGTLSHGAIIAREYGLPTVANVPGAMTRIQEGQWVMLDAGVGTIRLGQSDSSSSAGNDRAD